MEHAGDFFLGENAVGHFLEPDGTLTSGRHRYEPYRGEGHCDLVKALGRGEHPRCWCIRDGIRVEFTVLSEEFEPGHPTSAWWVTVDAVHVVGRGLTSEQLATLIVDALADGGLMDRAAIPKAVAIATKKSTFGRRWETTDRSSSTKPTTQVYFSYDQRSYR